MFMQITIEQVSKALTMTNQLAKSSRLQISKNVGRF